MRVITLDYSYLWHTCCFPFGRTYVYPKFGKIEQYPFCYNDGNNNFPSTFFGHEIRFMEEILKDGTY